MKIHSLRSALGGVGQRRLIAVLASFGLAAVVLMGALRLGEEVADVPSVLVPDADGAGLETGAARSSGEAVLPTPGGDALGAAEPEALMERREPSVSAAAVPEAHIPAGEELYLGPWTLSFEIASRAIVRAPGQKTVALYATVYHSNGLADILGRFKVPIPPAGPIVGRLKYLPHGPVDWKRTSSFVVATDPAGVNLSDRVFLDQEEVLRAGLELMAARDVDEEEHVVDLGMLSFEAVPLLGTFRIEAQGEVESVDVFLSPRPLGPRFEARVGASSPGRLARFSYGGGEVTAYSFLPGDHWSVLVKDSETKELLASEQALRGTMIEIPYTPPSGVSVRLDLKSTPEAHRVAVVSASVPRAESLSEEAYEARLENALVTVAVPLARFRGSQRWLETGLLELGDQQLRVEVWGRDGDGWRLLNSVAATVAGGVTEVDV